MRISDWSSDVCSSDLLAQVLGPVVDARVEDRAEHRILAHRGIEAVDQIGDDWLVDDHGKRLGSPLLAGGDGLGMGVDRFRTHMVSLSIEYLKSFFKMRLEGRRIG